jgi:hypothetical protein
MACSLYCCGVRSVAFGDEFTAQALEIAKTTLRRSYLNTAAILALCAVAVFNYGIMGLAVTARISDLAAGGWPSCTRCWPEHLSAATCAPFRCDIRADHCDRRYRDGDCFCD